jgi:UDP-N-acetylmuramoylalanine--D-glutamate ligase
MPSGLFLDMSFLEQLPSRSIAVVGAGVTGAAMIRFLKDKGVTPVLLDEKTISVEGISSTTDLNSFGEKYRNIDLAIVSPGWKKSNPLILHLEKIGTEIISEIDFAWRVKNEVAPHQKWISLTGTNGKTTTVQMVNSIFNSAGISGVACGNVGETVIEALQFEKPYDFLALELSSFQIDWSREARFVASAVLNIAEDHIDWHGSFDAYANAKMKILEYSEIGILNAEDPEIVTRASAWNGKKIYFSLETPQPGELGLVENILVDRAFIADPTKAEEIAELTDIRPTVPHNVSNALAAAGLARAIGISYEEIKKGISQFKVDHHRIETVLQKDGITWVNDSKATNPHAAIASILSHEKVVWIAGGLAKGASMDELVRRAKPRLSSVILIGTDASLIEKAILENAPEISFHKIENQENSEELMKSIVLYAKKIAKSGETVLLAPACASMDQFISYAHRGNLFADAVRSIVGK